MKPHVHSVKSRVVASFVAALLVCMLVVGTVAYLFLHWNEHKIVDETGVAAAETTAIVFGYAQDNGIDLGDADQYAELRSVLRGVCGEYGMSYVYCYACDLEHDTMTYLMCVASDDEADELVRRTRSYGTRFHRELSQIERNALEGQTERSAIEYDNELGHMLDWVCLVPDTDAHVLAAASYSVDDQRARVWQSTLLVLLPLALTLLVLLLVQLGIMKRHLFAPIALIAERMRSFSVAQPSEAGPLEISSNDEIRDIADAFESMAVTIREDVDNIERLTSERVQGQVELDVARRIQLGIVPGSTELARDAFCVSAFSRAARAVGGDFYVVSELDDGRVVAAIGDVSGKGVAAAMFMAVTRTVVHGALMDGLGPAEALSAVNRRLGEWNPEAMFVTVFACTFDPATGELRYANAGHMPPFVIGDGAQELDVDTGELLGIYDDVDLREGTLRLRPSEALLVFTDGATEALDAHQDFLGEARLMERLGAGCPYADATDIVDEAVRVVDEFTAGCEQFDDLTMFALMRR